MRLFFILEFLKR